MTVACALCECPLTAHTMRDGDNAFCCAGCHAVYTILLSKNQLANYQETTIFQQALRAGLISNPDLLDQLKSKAPPREELHKLHFEISEMWCPACAELIRLFLLQEKGIFHCIVDYATDLASVNFSPCVISKERIFALINSLGYRPNNLTLTLKVADSTLFRRFIVAAFCALNVMMLAYPLYATYFDYDDQGYGPLFAWLSLIMTIPVVTYSAWPIVRRFLHSFRLGLMGMETLVVIGVTTALGLSLYDLIQGGTKVYFDSVTVLIAFVLLGKIIESRAKLTAKSALLHLARTIPRRGRRRTPDGQHSFVPLKEVQIGDILVSYTGERIALDGVVIEGQGTCNEALLTGEAFPLSKEVGANVLGGSIVQHGTLLYRVTSSIEETTLHKIIEMVQEEILHKCAYVRVADVIVRWFVPLVLATAAVTALACWSYGIADPGKTVVETTILRAIAVLLISCPCAIGIAAPLAESHVMNALIHLGAIVRNRGCLALCGRETLFIFDKTGTVTEGKFKVQQGLEQLNLEQLSLLKGLATPSTHPLARAVVEAIECASTDLPVVEEIAGRGLRSTYKDELLCLGSAAFLQQQGIAFPPHKQEGIGTTIYFTHGQQWLATLVLGDSIRDGIKDLLQQLAPAKTYLLSGDTEASVEAVARHCGFDHWKGGCTPLEKRAFVDDLRTQGEIICMVGDGINDAPALAAAHVGISVVSATDISIQASDILLTTDRLDVMPKILATARKGRQIVSQNLFWAFFYNLVGIVLAMLGLLSPLFAAFAMVASSLMILLNTLRGSAP